MIEKKVIRGNLGSWEKDKSQREKEKAKEQKHQSK